MSEELTVYYDYVSPFSYMAIEMLPALAEEWGLTLDWCPIELLALSSFEHGLPYSDKKRSYVAVDAMRSAERHGIPIAMPEPFPVRSQAALRLAILAKRRGVLHELHAALARAAWVDARDIGDEDVLTDLLVAAGLEAKEWLAASSASALAAELASNTEAADSAGVFGVPTFVCRGELFWGIDSLPALRWRVEGGR